MLAGVEADTALLHAVADHMQKLPPVLASVTVVLVAKPGGMEVFNFIVAALAVQNRLPLAAMPLLRTDKARSSLSSAT